MLDTYCYIHATYTVDDGPNLADTTLYSMHGLYSFDILGPKSILRSWGGDPNFRFDLP